MLWYELADIMLLVKCIKKPDLRLKISKFITFSTTNTRSASFLKLSHHHHSRTNLSRHFYFNRVCRLWNALPPINLNLSSNTIKAKIKTTCGCSLLKTSTRILLVSFTLRVHVPNVCRYLCQPIILHVRSCNISVWLLKLYLCKISFNGILYILQACLQYCIFLIHSPMPTLSYYHCTVKPY